jgi:hypothetical protein
LFDASTLSAQDLPGGLPRFAYRWCQPTFNGLVSAYAGDAGLDPSGFGAGWRRPIGAQVGRSGFSWGAWPCQKVLRDRTVVGVACKRPDAPAEPSRPFIKQIRPASPYWVNKATENLLHMIKYA